MIPSRFNVTVADFPGTGKHILYNTRSQAQVVIDNELRDALAALPVMPAKPEAVQAFIQLEKMGFIVPSAEADDKALEAFFAGIRDNNATLRPTVLTTYACNFRCVYCVEDGLAAGAPMTAEAAEAAAAYIVDQFKRFGSRAIALAFYGGEPLLNMTAVRTVARMVRRFSEIQAVPFGFELSTNGSLLTPAVVEELKGLGLTGAKITLDGPRDVHDSYRPFRNGKGSFDLLLANIAAAAGEIEIKIEVNIDTGNSERIGELLDTLSALGLHRKIHELIFCPITPTPRDRDLARPSTEVACAPMTLAYAQKHVALQRLALEKGFPVDPRIVGHLCEMLAKRTHFIVDPAGTLFRCGGLVGRAEFSFGSVGGAEADHYMGTELWRRCAGCAYAPLCGHGCPFAAFIRYGDPLRLNCAKESMEYAVREGLKLTYIRKQEEAGGVKFTLFWRTVAARILAALVGVSILSIIISVVALSWQARGALIENIEQRNLEIARQASRQISRYVLDSIEELQSLGSIIGPLPYDGWIRDTMLANMALEFRKFQWMVLLGPDGTVQSDGRRVGGSPVPLDAGVVSAVLANRKVVGRQAEIGADLTPYLLVSTPVRSVRGSSGWLVAELHLRGIWDLLDSVTIDGKHVGFLVSGTGKLIAHYDKVRVMRQEDYDPFPPPPRDLPPDRDWRIERVNGVDTWLTAYSKVDVEGVDWDVGVQQLLSDAFLPASTLLRWSALLGIFGVAISVALGLLLSRVISAPLVHLLEGTRLISDGDLAHRIESKGGEELRKLADSFNGMVESLQQRTLQLAASERDYRLMTERVNDIIFSLDENGVLTFISPRLQELTGFAPSVALGKEILAMLPPGERGRYEPLLLELLGGNGRVTREAQFDFKTPDGRRVVMEARFTGEVGPGGRRHVYGVARDVSERARLLEQLGQAQKMEAVGRLAGGVAHDFNNLLTAIIGYCDYSLLDVSDIGMIQKNFEEIKKAGGRAAALTQQLLAFSRRQAMQPRIIDLNRVIMNLERLLHRLLGEDVVLEAKLWPQSCNVLADPGQIEQVIMNLCINARDAMPRGGRISITTQLVAMDGEAASGGLRGEHVRMRIIDNGAGMDAETKSHLFEPFFTTKEVGKGTGLGLSTVYGIVKQTNGSIWVESEPGAGTTFEILLPSALAAAEAEPPVPGSSGLRGGNETVLLVEDESVIRSLVRNVLSSHGYGVLEAEDGEKALGIFRSRRSDIDMIIADVVLPGAGGRDIVERMLTDRPGVSALFMSGYTRDIIDNHGVLTPGLAFLQKPFTPEMLLRKVREVLDGRRQP